MLALFTFSSPAQELTVRARPIAEFHIGRSTEQFGALRFVGGLELTARSPFGGFSAFRFLEAGTRFAGVSDTGFWFFGKITRDATGRPISVKDFHMEPITGPNGELTTDKREVDAEGLAIIDGKAIVSFEREHRVSEYLLQPGSMGRQARNLDFLIPWHELRQNRGIETVLAAPKTAPFEGAILVLAEMSLNPRGDIFASVLSGPRKGVFFIKRSNDFDITDAAFLPSGDILILERRFSWASGVAMRIRRLIAEEIRPGVTVDGPALLTADMAYQIDNMEGMDIWQAKDGTTRLSLISDDNRSILQRNIYLEFILTKD